MPYKEPNNLHFIALFIAILGGTASYMAKYLNGEKVSVLGWIATNLISVFVSLLAYFACQVQGLSFELTVVIVGLASYNGTRGLLLVSKIIGAKISVVVEEKK